MYGILTPLLVRPIKDGTYEIISGHRRKRVAYRMKNEAMKQKVGRKKGQNGQQKKARKQSN